MKKNSQGSVLAILRNILHGGKYREINIGAQAFQRITRETISGILRVLPWHLAFFPVFMTLYCVVLAQWVDGRDLLLWYIIVVLSSSIPLGYLYYRYHQDGPKFSYALAERLLVLAAIFTSLFVGLSSWLFFGAVPGNTVLLLIILLSLGPAVAAVAFAGSMYLWLGITLGLMIPIVSYIFIAWQADDIISGALFGFWLLIYLAYTLFIAYMQNIFVKENLYLKFQLEAALKTRSQYLEIASHDLRQPMHAMGLFIDALAPHVEQQGQQAYSRLNDSVLALRGLFDSLLDMSRLDANLVEPNYQTIALQPHVQKLVNEFKGPAGKKGLTISLSCEQLSVCSDVVLLERILRNLLSNAVKFTESGSIAINCNVCGDSVIISIQDQGPGIAASEQEGIFSEYQQLDQPPEVRTHGLGLGLAIVRRISDLMNVPVWVDSSAGKGACFSFVLPISSSSTEPLVEQHAAWDLQGLFIIVIDDEPDVLAGMGQVLALWGCQTLLANSLDQVLEKMPLSPEMPAIIIADYRLGDGLTGVAAIESIREEFNHDIPALLITGDKMTQGLQQAKDDGLMVMNKPIAPAGLRSAIYQSINPLH